MESIHHPLLGRTIGGRYQLKRVLGRGGMGAVFLAFDAEREAEIALKLLRDTSETTATLPSDLEKRLEREVHLLSALTAEEDDATTRIIKLYDWGREPDIGLFYTMEWLPDAETLMAFADGHSLKTGPRLRLAQELLVGLGALHARRIVHRDLKPSNALCWQSPKGPQLKLIDLGIARWFSDVIKTHATVETATGAMLGSPAYMAPEMWRNEDVDARTDIYQMGILLYQLLLGELPFKGTPHQLMFQHLHGYLPSIASQLQEKEPSLPEEALAQLDALLQRATHVNPDERPSDAQALLEALQMLPIGLEEDASPAPIRPAQPSPAPVDLPSGQLDQSDFPDASEAPDDEVLTPITSARSKWTLVGLGLGLLLVLGWWQLGGARRPAPQARQLRPVAPPQGRTDREPRSSASHRRKPRSAHSQRPTGKGPRSRPALGKRAAPRRRKGQVTKRPRPGSRPRPTRSRSRLGKPGLTDTLLIP